ncbi:MAG: 50S ribosomal protein L11 methyltransferase [Fidelibacterota bacterium]|nr:MAG: 50S ribosomal protein L11 methyltransferase [Candidatus Neomarinimicrobiota bacterium]
MTLDSGDHQEMHEIDKLRLLRLEGPPEALEACLGLLTPWVRGGREYSASPSAVDGQLDLYITAEDAGDVEAAWTSWRGNALPALENVTMRWSSVPVRDWELEWREHFEPLRITDDIVVVPEWDRATKAPVLIRLRPGMAFGTGHHATTRLAIQKLEYLGCRDQRVLDLGTGSGVLAIVAKCLGARHVVAVDQDPSSADNFSTNLRLNGLDGQIRYIQEDVEVWHDFNHDLIVANINRTVIFPLMEHFSQSRTAAILIVSGLLAQEESQFLDHCQELNLQSTHLEQEEDWVCAVVSKPEGDQAGHPEMN